MLVLPALGCGSAHERPAAVLTQTGRIGPLRMDVSTGADVIAFAGRPDAERPGRYSGAAPYRALGYDCSKKRGYGWALGDRTWCKTVVLVHPRTGRLGELYTASIRHYGRHG